MYIPVIYFFFLFFFFNDTATTEIYTLSLHDALPIWWTRSSSAMKPSRTRTVPSFSLVRFCSAVAWPSCSVVTSPSVTRSEEHTSELQSRPHLVCRLLLEKKKSCSLAFLRIRVFTAQV